MAAWQGIDGAVCRYRQGGNPLGRPFRRLSHFSLSGVPEDLTIQTDDQDRPAGLLYRGKIYYDRMFDDVELSKRTLAKNWNSLNVAQRQEFVLLFRQVLEKAYIDKILAYTDEKIVFDRETMVSGTQAEIQTKIVTPSKEIPISYRVLLKDGAWKVYDVVIENVSLVLNYRTQFNDILAKNTPEQLIEILRKKVKGQ